jgi:hypothetical protein
VRWRGSRTEYEQGSVCSVVEIVIIDDRLRALSTNGSRRSSHLVRLDGRERGNGMREIHRATIGTGFGRRVELDLT